MLRAFSRHRSRSGSRDGVALVLVLACISLLAILIVSYVAFTSLNRSSTASYSKTIQAQEIAMGGLQEILGDLHSEIIAGSTGGGTTTSGVVAYLPASAATAQPLRLGYTAASWTNDYNPAYLAPTLVRVSRASGDPTPTDVYPMPLAGTYPGGTFPINRASPVSTTTAFGDGPYISAARWNKTYLLATNAAGVPAPFTTAPPDWVYVTRTGSRVCQASELASLKPSANLSQNYGAITPGSNPPASPIVGRYAFVMYDEGALLDVNAAGAPSTLISGTPSAPVTSPSVPAYTDTATGLSVTLPGKTSLASADLTQLPGLSGAQTSVIDKFLNWRNYGSLQSTGTTGPNFLQIAYTYGKNGFVSYSTGDNPVLGRQDLINYFTSIDPGINTGTATYSRALPYLGTFSRALNEPSWTPTVNAPSGGIYNYANNAEVSTGSPFSTGSPNPNRDLANVRFTAAGSIKHYADDGSSTTSSVNAGDPLLQHRFSLAKLAWLTHTGIATGISSQAVQDCFGLQWNSSAYRWDYYGSKASPQGTIETLDQVASEGREPNFFELLKAGILAGSLGKNPGVATNGPFLNDVINSVQQTSHVEGPLGSGFDQTSANADFQIIQIGVNIIDQSRADNYPSGIYFNFNPAIGVYSPTELALYQTAFGKKNLPYIQGMGEISAVTADVSSTMETFSAWLQPELWNPHQNPYGTYPGAVAPQQLRLVTVGQAAVMNESDAAYPLSLVNPSTPIDFGEDWTNPTAAGLIYFSNSADYFKNPIPLTDSYPGSTTTPSQNVWPPSIPHPLDGHASFSGSGNQFYGVFCGAVERPLTKPPLSTATTSSAPGGNNIRINPQTPLYPLTFVLEYFDGTNWMPYSTISRINVMGNQNLAGGSAGNGIHAWGSTTPKVFFGSIDPRTERFSVAQSYAQGYTAPQGWNFTDTIQWNANPATPPPSYYGSMIAGYPHPSSGFAYAPVPSDTNDNQEIFLNLWQQNQVTPANPNPATSSGYYWDPDGVVRPADAFRGNVTTGYGMMTYHVGSGSTDATSAAGRRPVILNRPFRSVGELGYVFRDLPFKSLDFWSSNSADAALLDLFSVTDEPQVVAGQINPSNAPQPVLQAVLSGTMKNEALSPNVALTAADAQTLATQISNQLVTGPLRNRSDLVSAISAAITVKLGSIPDLGNKSYGEAPIRALAPVANTRTWNLLIDIIAQAGQLSPGASSIADFVVQGERRYWLHIAIDRYTGKIIDQQLEPVYE